MKTIEKDIDQVASEFAKVLLATEAWLRVSRPSEERSKLKKLYLRMMVAICQIEDIVNNQQDDRTEDNQAR